MSDYDSVAEIGRLRKENDKLWGVLGYIVSNYHVIYMPVDPKGRRDLEGVLEQARQRHEVKA